MKKPDRLHDAQRERLEELQEAVSYPLKLKRDKDGGYFLAATAKGRTVDTGSVEVDASGFGGLFSIWYRDGDTRALFQEYLGNAETLVDLMCYKLGMQPRII